MQLTVLLMMASGTLGLPNRLNPFLPIHDLFSAAQIDKLNSIVDRKSSDFFVENKKFTHRKFRKIKFIADIF